MSTYLGKLCVRGHDHEGTGKALRSSGRRTCKQCERESKKERFKNNPESLKRHYRQCMEWASRNRERVRAIAREGYKRRLGGSLKRNTTYVLGALCRHGHDHEGSGKSLRYASRKNECVLCNKEYYNKTKKKELAT